VGYMVRPCCGNKANRSLAWLTPSAFTMSRVSPLSEQHPPKLSFNKGIHHVGSARLIVHSQPFRFFLLEARPDAASLVRGVALRRHD
jgi:hypothetical protein